MNGSSRKRVIKIGFSGKFSFFGWRGTEIAAKDKFAVDMFSHTHISSDVYYYSLFCTGKNFCSTLFWFGSKLIVIASIDPGFGKLLKKKLKNFVLTIIFERNGLEKVIQKNNVLIKATRENYIIDYNIALTSSLH